MADEPRRRAAASSTARCRSCRSSSSKIGRTAIYGSFFNFYLCTFKGRVVAARRQRSARLADYDVRNAGTARCNLG